MGVMDKFLNYMKLNEDEEEYETDDDYIDDEEDDYVEPAKKSSYKDAEEDKPAKKTPLTKVTPIPKNTAKRMQSAGGMEVCVFKPTQFDESREITDTLLNGCTVVLNFEGLDVEIAQRIIDFTSGSCYAIGGNLQKVSNYIFIVTPKSVDISGDFQEILSGAFDIPTI